MTIRNFASSFAFTAALLVGAGTFVGCDRDDSASDKMHNAKNDAKDAAHDAKNDVKDAAHDAKNNVKDATH